jgi:hypothetical protein
LTLAESTGYSPGPAPLSKALEQMRFMPWGEGERLACAAGSQRQDLYKPWLSQASTSALPVVGGS